MPAGVLICILIITQRQETIPIIQFTQEYDDGIWLIEKFMLCISDREVRNSDTVAKNDTVPFQRESSKYF